MMKDLIKGRNIRHIIVPVIICLFIALGGSALITGGILERELSDISKSIAGHFAVLMKEYTHSFLMYEKLMEQEIERAANEDEIETYLKTNDKSLMEIAGEDYDGIYMYYHDRYIYSWDTPFSVYEESGYNAKDRPWYKGAVASEGEIWFSTPYHSYANDYMLATISRLQPDGETVFAYDIKLGQIQDYAKDLELHAGSLTMLCDISGNIIGSNDPIYTGGNYLLPSEEIDKQIQEAKETLASAGEEDKEKAKDEVSRLEATKTLCMQNGTAITKAVANANELCMDMDNRVLAFCYVDGEYACVTVIPMLKVLPLLIGIWAVLLLFLILLICLLFFRSAKRRTRQTIEENEVRLRSITNNIKGGVVELKSCRELNITYANDGFLKLIDSTREQFEKEKPSLFLNYVHPEDSEAIGNAIASNQEEISLELRIRKTTGLYIPVLFTCTKGEVRNGSRGLYCIIMDLSDREMLLEQLRMDKHRTDLLLNCVDEIFFEVNMQDLSISTSNSFFEKFGWTLPSQLPELKDEYIARTWQTDPENVMKILSSTKEMLTKKEPESVIAMLRSKKEKRFIWCEIVQHPFIAQDGSVISVIGSIRDVDTQISERKRLIEQAQHDPLTGLYNKEAFEILVTDALARNVDENNAMVFVDLDHFKNVNDTLGHMVGDQAICDAADKLRVIFSNYDILGRFGGDEFCIFMKNIPEDVINRKLDWLLEKLYTKYHGVKGDVAITCSCGVACTKGRATEYQVLIQQADEALYLSKVAGRNRYTFYSDAERGDSPKKRTLD